MDVEFYVLKLREFSPQNLKYAVTIFVDIVMSIPNKSFLLVIICVI